MMKGPVFIGPMAAVVGVGRVRLEADMHNHRSFLLWVAAWDHVYTSDDRVGAGVRGYASYRKERQL